MNSKFFHDFSNLLTIASGKAKHVDLLLNEANTPQNLEESKKRLKTVIEKLKQMEDLLIIEKASFLNKKDLA